MYQIYIDWTDAIPIPGIYIELHGTRFILSVDALEPLNTQLKNRVAVKYGLMRYP